MKLLIVTQTVDERDPVLGFFVAWIRGLAKQFDSMEVICLKEGKHTLPAHVRVHSLGKEKGPENRFTYAIRFKKLAWRLRHDYDAIFVHMNQEYLLVAGPLWKLLGKSAFLWYNHHDGGVLTDIAASFCKKVFCTSRYSYTAHYKKTVFMPVGVDTDIFRADERKLRARGSILSLGRIAPSKHLEVFVKALALLSKEDTSFSAAIYGDALPKDISYEEGLHRNAEQHGVSALAFRPGVRHEETPALYRDYDIFVNCSSSGMYDKTIFEAMASETLVAASNKNLEGLVDEAYIFPENNASVLAEKLRALLSLSQLEKARRGKELRAVVEKHHSFKALMEKLASALHPA